MASLNKNKAGQTLIETLVAIFMLVMGVTAAIGLAIYAFNSSSTVTKQIIATGLAREGVEAVKNMRDTNWLKDALTINGCYDYASSQANKANCYQNWLGSASGTVPFCINPTSGNGPCIGDISGSPGYNNVLRFDSSSANFWVKFRGTNSHGYGLTFNPVISGNGFYNDGINSDGTNGIACQDGASDQNGVPISNYCRKIIITKDTTTAPYNTDANLSLLKVQSQVWWVDKKCPRSLDWPGLGKCSIELDSYLTNWKDY